MSVDVDVDVDVDLVAHVQMFLCNMSICTHLSLSTVHVVKTSCNHSGEENWDTAANAVHPLAPWWLHASTDARYLASSNL